MTNEMTGWQFKHNVWIPWENSSVKLISFLENVTSQEVCIEYANMLIANLAFLVSHTTGFRYAVSGRMCSEGGGGGGGLAKFVPVKINWWCPEPPFQFEKSQSSIHGDSHYKDKKVSQPS